MTLDFQDWLNKQMQRFGWEPSELARRAQVSTATITRIGKGDRRPGLQTCLKLSKVFDLPIENVLRAAGYSVNSNQRIPEEENWIELLNQLNDEERGYINRICRGFILTRNK